MISRKRKSYLDDYLDEIREHANKTGANKAALFDFFKDKYGEETFKSYSTFSHYMNNHQILCGHAKDKLPHVLYETNPGVQLQVDWVEGLKIELKNGEIIEYNLFSATWSYSRLHFFIYTKTKTTEDFLRCLIEVFYRSNGTPLTVLTDNMSAVAACTGQSRKKHSLIQQFEKDTGIHIQLCNPRSPQTKGKCESANRFAKRLQAWQGTLESESELIEKIELLNRNVNQKNNETTHIPPIVLFEKEKEHLRPVANKILLETYLKDVDTQIVPPTLLVHHKGNKYSVSKKFIHERVKLVPCQDKLYIYSNMNVIAIHTIQDQKINYRLEDYQEALQDQMPYKEEDDIAQMAEENLKRLEDPTFFERSV